jgi:hypothetical protein
MMIIAPAIVCGVTLFLLIVLFALKRAEATRGRRFGVGLRDRADARALRIKASLENGEAYLSEVPFYFSALSRYFVHVGALSFAKIARASAQRAHQLADLVSHKRGFERRETKSQFLREVSEAKNGNGSSSNSTPQV